MPSRSLRSTRSLRVRGCGWQEKPAPNKPSLRVSGRLRGRGEMLEECADAGRVRQGEPGPRLLLADVDSPGLVVELGKDVFIRPIISRCQAKLRVFATGHDTIHDISLVHPQGLDFYGLSPA